MSPNCVLVMSVLSGALKFGWLKMLNVSARNWNEYRSVIGNDLKSEKSSFLYPGPVEVSVLPPRAPAPVAGMQPVGLSAMGVGLSMLPPNTQGWLKAFGLLYQR